MKFEIDCAEKDIVPLLKILQQQKLIKKISLFSESPLPSIEEADAKAFEELAQRVAQCVEPTAKQPMRREALEFALGGGDTFHPNFLDPPGGDTALRNALGALSKALRKVYPIYQSPIDQIAYREKTHSKDGHYLGTRYVPTKLGKRVRAILIEKGAIS